MDKNITNSPVPVQLPVYNTESYVGIKFLFE